MHRRLISQSRIGETQTRFRTVIEDDESAPDSEAARIRRYMFLKELADNQELLNCGYHKFSTLRIYHNGSRWLAEMECVAANDP